MKYYRFPENKFVKLCFPLFLLILQMVSRSTMYTSNFLGFMPAQAIMIGLVLVIGAAFLIVNRKNLKQILLDRRMLAFALCVAILLIPMLVKRDWQAMYLFILLCWFVAVFFTYFTTTQELGRWYVLIMAALSIYSMVGLFVLKPLTLAGILPGFRFDSPGGWHMFNYGLTFVCDKNNHMDDALRAFGIFREPGLFQIFLFVAIQLNNYTVQWKKQWQMWLVDAILFLSLLTTFATGGVLALGLYMVFLFFDKGLYKVKKLRILAVIAVILGIALLAFALMQGGTWAYELIGMVEKVVNQTYSFTARTESIAADAKLFLQNPVFGAGLAEVMYAVPNNTASSPIFFAAFGILGGCVHVLSWVALAWKKERKLWMNLILLVILFIPFNTQNVIHDMFFWLFPMMALTEKSLSLLENREKRVK